MDNNYIQKFEEEKTKIVINDASVVLFMINSVLDKYSKFMDFVNQSRKGLIVIEYEKFQSEIDKHQSKIEMLKNDILLIKKELVKEKILKEAVAKIKECEYSMKKLLSLQKKHNKIIEKNNPKFNKTVR